MISGLVLAAGGSSRLGQPKQLLPYRGRTLLDAVLDTARASPLDQIVVTLGAEAGLVREKVDLSGCDVILNESFGEGCSSSIASGLSAVTGDVMVLLLGDQPGVEARAIEALLGAEGSMRACRYDDGRGHPLAFTREVFGELEALKGDKAVWRLIAEREVVEARVEGRIPLDVDTWEDYEAVTA